jgi:DNA-binding transcriptional LysR family regulator
LAVCEAGSFTKAAERLHLTQPAVSQHVKRLEDRFGVPLFQVQGRGIFLTEAGELLRNYAATAEADGARTEALIRDLGRRRRMRFGATRTIGEYVLPDRLAAYLRTYPDAEVSLRVDNTEALLAQLRGGDIDFAFIEGLFDREEYETRLFLQDAFIPICAAGDPLATGKPDFLQLKDRRLIVRERGSGSRLILERTLEGMNRSITNFARILELGNLEAIKRLVAGGAGIAFLYEQSVSKELASGSLARIDWPEFSVSHDYTFAFLKNSLYADRYLEFLDFCRSC